MRTPTAVSVSFVWLPLLLAAGARGQHSQSRRVAIGVTDATGGSVSGAPIVVHGKSIHAILEMSRGSKVAAVVELPLGTYQVDVESPGFLTATRRIEIQRDGSQGGPNIDFVVAGVGSPELTNDKPADSLEVSVPSLDSAVVQESLSSSPTGASSEATLDVHVDDISGANIPKAQVTAWKDGKKVSEAQTGENGDTVLKLMTGSYEIRAAALGFRAQKTQVSVGGRGSSNQSFRLQVESGGGPMVSREDSPLNHLDLWSPSLDNVWIPRQFTQKLSLGGGPYGNRQSP